MICYKYNTYNHKTHIKRKIYTKAVRGEQVLKENNSMSERQGGSRACSKEEETACAKA